MELFAGYDIAVTVIAIMLAIAGIIYGIGYALDDRKLKDFGRNELYQSLINGAIIGVLFLAFSPSGIITSVINTTAGSTAQVTCDPSLGYNSAICFSYDYLVGITVNVNNHTYPSLLTSSGLLLGSTTLLYMAIGTVSTFNINLIFFSFGLSGLKFALGPLQEVITLLFTSIIATVAQAALLKVIAVVAIPVLLPIGLVLRSLYFTRRLGGTIIAIAIGFFAVFPLTYLLDAQLLSTFATGPSNSIYSIASSLNGTASSATQLGMNAANQSTIYQAQGANSMPNSTSMTGTSMLGSIYSGAGGLIALFAGAVLALEKAVAFIIVQVFLLPVLSLVLTLVSIRELARILGTEVTFGRFDLF